MNFLNASFRVGRLFDINIRVHILFLFFIVWQLIDGGSDWQFTLMFLTMLFGTVLVHEFGHCFGARSVGGYAENILMWPLGGLAYAHAPMRPWPQFVTVACGPLVNVIFCLISGGIIVGYTHSFHYVLLNPFGPLYIWGGSMWMDCLYIFYQVNLLLLAFNLLPIYPLDGGQLFHAIIWPMVGLQRATLIACQVGLVGCAVLGIWSLMGEGRMLLFIAIFGGFTCWQQYQAARHGFLQEDSPYETYHGPSYDPRPWWQRILRVGKRRPRDESSAYTIEFPRPRRSEPEVQSESESTERAREEAELDHILKKVSERGIASLSYVERQRLEHITRKRQEESQGVQHPNRR